VGTACGWVRCVPGRWASALILTALLAAGTANAAQAAPAAVVSDRFSVLVDGRQVGSAEWTTDTRPGRESHVEALSIRTTQARGRAAIESRFETRRQADGSWRFARFLTAGLMQQRDSGRIADGRVSVTRRGKSVPATAPSVPEHAVFPAALAVRLADGGGGEDRFDLIDVPTLRAVPAEADACPAAVARDVPGRCVRLRIRGVPAREEHWFFDAAGQVQRLDSDLGGLPLSLVRCTGDCHRTVAEPLDLVGRMVVASPYRIPEAASQRKLRYVLSRDDGNPVLAAATGDQDVVRSEAKAVVTVCRHCAVESPGDAGTTAAYLRPNPWLQSDSPEVRRLAARAGIGDGSVDARMRRLTAVVPTALRREVDYIGYTDAVQAIRSRRGGCAEFAAVLAALARSQDIPARVVVGLAYSDRFSGRKNVFSPHAWVQAWDGERWISYDAALGDFDSTHIALAVGDGSPDTLYAAFAQLPHLRIERAGVVASP
jgi:Transglutaminase-like superfamily